MREFAYPLRFRARRTHLEEVDVVVHRLAAGLAFFRQPDIHHTVRCETRSEAAIRACQSGEAQQQLRGVARKLLAGGTAARSILPEDAETQSPEFCVRFLLVGNEHPVENPSAKARVGVGGGFRSVFWIFLIPRLFVAFLIIIREEFPGFRSDEALPRAAPLGRQRHIGEGIGVKCRVGRQRQRSVLPQLQGKLLVDKTAGEAGRHPGVLHIHHRQPVCLEDIARQRRELLKVSAEVILARIHRVARKHLLVNDAFHFLPVGQR